MLKKYLGYIGDLFRTIRLKLRFGKKIKIDGVQHVKKNCSFEIDNGELFIGRRSIFNSYTNISTKEGGIVKIGNNVFLGRFCNIACHDHVTIGDNCRLGPNVQIFDHNHKFCYEGIIPGYRSEGVEIGNGTWVGANVTILKNTIIGEKCVIGAGSVVSGIIPSHSIVKPSRELEIIPIEINK